MGKRGGGRWASTDGEQLGLSVQPEPWNPLAEGEITAEVGTSCPPQMSLWRKPQDRARGWKGNRPSLQGDQVTGSRGREKKAD